MTAFPLAAGVALLLILAADVFSTVFKPGGSWGAPLTRLQGRVIWKAWKALAPRKGPARASWLSLSGPLMAVLAPATWALMLVCRDVKVLILSPF